ncbi:MAG: TolC family protein [Lachnospiraceae bacterium]|nr:TolC family protein [Lachnospiraceae bacterium]
MKRKLGKRLGAGLLSCVLLMSTALPVWAGPNEDPSTLPKMENINTKRTDKYTEEQLNDNKVEFGELEFLVTHNNHTVRSNRYTYDNLLDSYETFGGSAGLSQKEVKDYYLQFDEAENTMLKTAQGLYPSYYQLMYSLEQLEANLSVAETSYQGALVQKEYGLCTDKEVSDALYNVTSIKNSIADVENQIVTLKQELCKLIGKFFNEDIELGEIPEIDDEYIADIDLYEDIEIALKSNYDVLSQENAMSDYGPSDSGMTKNADYQAWLAALESTRAKVRAAYLDIQTQHAATKQAEEKLASAVEQLKQAEQEYNLGLISRLEYEQQKAGYVAEESSCKTEKMKLFEKVNTYEWCLLGL